MARRKKKSSARAAKGLHERVRTARGRKSSSTRWLQRQLNDPYVAAARQEGYRSRAAYKLVELDDRFQFLSKGAVVIDLGAAPGGWTQVAVERAGAGNVIAIDIEEMMAIEGADCFQLDFMDPSAPARLAEAAPAGADVVLSDMAAPATGHKATDHLRIMALCEAALDFARHVLRPGGTFVAKVFKGGTENELLESMKRDFDHVRHAKPRASRKESAESYVIAQGFHGANTPLPDDGTPPASGYDPLAS